MAEINLAPIVLFVYNRPEHTRKTVEALMKNDLAVESELFIFADGPKSTASYEQITKINKVREYIHSITGFKSVRVEESHDNKGLANSVIAGVTRVINKFGKVIVVEDDIVTHPFFLRYMNDCLYVYKDRSDIYMVGGYNYNLRFPRLYKKDVYVVHRSCSWGWATWKECWANADWDVADFTRMITDYEAQLRFNRGGADMFPMLQAQMLGQIDSWAIRWDYSMYKHDAVCVCPVRSLCDNIGMDGSGVHCCEVISGYTAPMNNQDEYSFSFNPQVKVNSKIEQEFAYYLQTGGLHKPSNFDVVTKKIKNTYKRYKHRIIRLLHRRNIPFGAILMLHRVDNPNENGIWFNEHLKISPKVVEEMVTYAKSKGCRFVSLDEITRKRRFWEQPRKQIAITLDDGYKDNYLYGAPLFRRQNVPYCIYVCTKMVKGNMLYWWEILERLIVSEDCVSIILADGREQKFDCSTKENKEQTFLDIREIILKLPQENLEEHLKSLFSKYTIDNNLGNDTLGLTWEQIDELTNDQLCTIGNHTYSHKSFTGCSDEEIKDDIERATKTMIEHVGYEMHHFAFPFGEATAVSQHDIEIVKSLGFKSSATTQDGMVCYGTDRLELPRIFVTEKNWKEVIDRIVHNC